MLVSMCGKQPNHYQSFSIYEIVFACSANLLSCLSHKVLSSKQQLVAACAAVCITMECLRVGRLDRLDSGSGWCCSSPGKERGRPGPDWGMVHHSSPFPSVWGANTDTSHEKIINATYVWYRPNSWTWSTLTAEVSKYSIPWLWAHSSPSDVWTALRVDKSDLFPTRTPENIQKNKKNKVKMNKDRFTDNDIMF